MWECFIYKRCEEQLLYFIRNYLFLMSYKRHKILISPTNSTFILLYFKKNCVFSYSKLGIIFETLVIQIIILIKVVRTVLEIIENKFLCEN